LEPDLLDRAFPNHFLKNQALLIYAVQVFDPKDAAPVFLLIALAGSKL
jgi:hypothetical protein